MQKIVFLDRDGVINKYPGRFKYVCSQKEFRFLPKAKEAIKRLHEAGYKIFVISNQAGITKKLYSQETLDDITKDMLKEIKKTGGKIERVLYCIHTEEQNCSCRKPKTGLIKEALKSLKGKIYLKKSFFVGDSIRDVEAGNRAGYKTILVLSGREAIKNKPEWKTHPDFIAENLFKAADIVLKRAPRKKRKKKVNPYGYSGNG